MGRDVKPRRSRRGTADGSTRLFDRNCFGTLHEREPVHRRPTAHPCQGTGNQTCQCSSRFQENCHNCSDGALTREHWEEYFSLGHEIQEGNVIPRGLQTTVTMPSRRTLDLFGGDRRPLQADDLEEGSLSELFRDETGYNFERILARFPPLKAICVKWKGNSVDRVEPAGVCRPVPTGFPRNRDSVQYYHKKQIELLFCNNNFETTYRMCIWRELNRKSKIHILIPFLDWGDTRRGTESVTQNRTGWTDECVCVCVCVCLYIPCTQETRRQDIRMKHSRIVEGATHFAQDAR